MILFLQNFDPHKIKIDENSYKNILIYYIGYGKIKNSKYVKMNGHFEEINKKKYLTLVHTNKRKGITKKYEELWSKISDLIHSITKNSDDYDENPIRMTSSL